MPTPLIRSRQLGPDVGRANQFVNGGFEFNQRGASTYPAANWGLDRWTTSVVGSATYSSSGPDTAHVDVGSAQCIATVVTATSNGAGGSATWCTTQQMLEHYKQLRGIPLSASFRVMSAIAGSSRGYWYDGNYNYSPALATPAGAYTTLRWTFTPAANAPTLYVGVTFDTVTTWYVDNAMLVCGPGQVDFVPMPMTDDLARCLRYYEIIGTPTATAVELGLGVCYTTANAVVSWKWVQKAVTPTLTVVGSPGLINAGGAVIAISSVQGQGIGLNCGGVILGSGGGLVAGNGTRLYAQAAQQYITLEANP